MWHRSAQPSPTAGPNPRHSLDAAARPRTAAACAAWPSALAALVLAAAALGGALVAGGCRGEARPDRGARLGSDAEWAWLVAAKHELDAERGELDALPASASGAVEPSPAAGMGGPAPASGAALPAAPPGIPAGGLAPRERLSRIDAQALQYGRRLVAYINADPPVEGVPLTARQLAAIRMKSDEEIVVAHQFIARAGDYRRACEIYEAALAADPRNPRLLEELARARAARFISAARFALATPGMTGEQVRAALGAPNANDVRSYPDKGVVGWFYPKDGSGAAAAVWFEKRDGALIAYASDWTAVGLPASGPAAAAPTPGAAGAVPAPGSAGGGAAAGSGGTGAHGIPPGRTTVPVPPVPPKPPAARGSAARASAPPGAPPTPAPTPVGPDTDSGNTGS